MKIVCDACGTRYSIEDIRVAGRSFKIRCKHCAHVIVLSGPRASTAEPAAAGTWHAVIDGMPRPIASGLGQIDTSGCGARSAAHGDVSVSVKVSPAGAVTGVTVRSSPDPALDACVTAAVRKGSFPATQRGGSFGYLWRF